MNTKGGFKINGERAGDLAGFAVGDVGDLDGNGGDEVLVGAPDNDPSGRDAGGFGRVPTNIDAEQMISPWGGND